MANPSSSQDSADKFVQGRVDEGLRAAERIRDPELKARWIEWVKRFPDDVKKLDQAEASLKDLTAEIDKLQVRLDESRKKAPEHCLLSRGYFYAPRCLFWCSPCRPCSSVFSQASRGSRRP